MKQMNNRRQAWRSVMVSAINYGLEQKIFDLEPSEERFEEIDYDFLINDFPAKVKVSDAGWDELSVLVDVWPKFNNAPCLHLSTRFQFTDCHASGWLERRKGKWLQTPYTLSGSFFCKKDRLLSLSDIDVSPIGYDDHGKFMM